MNRALQYVLVFIAGCSIHLAFAPYELWLVSLAGLALFAALISVSGSSRAAFRLALVFGSGLFGAGVNWVYASIHIYGEVPAIPAFILTAGFAFFLALLFALPWLALPQLARSRSLRLLCFPALWFFGEWLRGWLLTGFPWLYLGYGQVEGPLSGLIPVVGVLGGGAVLATVASLLVYCIDRGTLKSGAVTAAGLALIWGLGTGLKGVDWTTPKSGQVPVSLVQPDIPLRDKWNPSKTGQILEALENNSRGAWRPGLLIWPEAAIPYTGPLAEAYMEFLDERSKQSDTAMITGLLTYDSRQDRYLNSVAGLGSADNSYHKQRLVPFGEYLPLEDWLRGTMKFFDLPMSVISRGPSNQKPLTFRFQNQQFRIAPAICYEIAYAALVRSLARDADMLLTLSNDAWFGASIGPWQHMQIAQARALENQKPLARVTNNGITGLVDHRGNITEALPQFKQAMLTAMIEPRSGATPYTRLGDWPLLSLAILLAASSYTRSRKNRRQSEG